MFSLPCCVTNFPAIDNPPFPKIDEGVKRFDNDIKLLNLSEVQCHDMTEEYLQPILILLQLRRQ